MKKKERRKLKKQEKEYKEYQERAMFYSAPSIALESIKGFAKRIGMEVDEESFNEWQGYLETQHRLENQNI